MAREAERNRKRIIREKEELRGAAGLRAVQPRYHDQKHAAGRAWHVMISGLELVLVERPVVDAARVDATNQYGNSARTPLGRMASEGADSLCCEGEVASEAQVNGKGRKALSFCLYIEFAKLLYGHSLTYDRARTRTRAFGTMAKERRNVR